MTQSQITYFLTVAKTLSFSKAAAVLSVSQPAVSKQVSLLEDEFGMTLFDRTRQGVFLTETGRLFNELFQDYIDRFQETLELARQVNRGLKAIVRIACSEGFHLSQFYADVQSFFDEGYPNIKLELSCVSEEELPQLLKSGQIDLVLTMQPPTDSGPDLVHQRLDLPNGESIHMGWLTSLNGKGGKHLVINELLFHFKRDILPELQAENETGIPIHAARSMES